MLVEQSYYGGRLQLLKPGAHIGVWHYDFPSMYGTLLSEELPVRLELAEASSIELPGFYEVDFSRGDGLAAALPVKQRSGSVYKTLYPASGSGVYWHEELKNFVSLGGRLGPVKRAAVVLESSAFLKDFSAEMLALKAGGCRFAKLALNGAYGSLARRHQASPDILMRRSAVEEGGMPASVSSWTSYGDLVLARGGWAAERAAGTNVAAASAVAAKARVRLSRLLDRIEGAGCDVIYIDTDAVYFTGTPPKVEGVAFSHASSLTIRSVRDVRA